MAAALGYGAEPADAAMRERLELASLLKLQHEVTASRLLGGAVIGTDELIKLTETIATMLPKPAPQGLVIRFVGGAEDSSRIDSMSDERLEALTSLLERIDGKAPLSAETTAVVIAELQAENAKLRSKVEPLQKQVSGLTEQIQQLRRGSSEQGEAEITRHGPPVSHGEVLPPAPTRALPRPVEHADAYATLAALNAGFNPSPYVEPDRFDKFGRRLDEHGLPQSRRMDCDGA
jgi:hypothetical protein